MKKVFLGIIVFILIIIIPYLPYKKAFSEKVYDESKINIQIRYSEIDGDILVTYGKKHLKEYVVSKNIRHIDINKIKLCGKEPYKEIANFEIGSPSFRDFVVTGKFLEHKSDSNILFFEVDNWFPVLSSVKLKDTSFWHRYNYSLLRISILSFLGVLIVCSTIIYLNNRK